MKIIFGYVVYWQDNKIFRSALRIASMVADRINIVYGRFKGFDLSYYPHPKYMEEDFPKGHLYEIDNLYPQHKQRDWYLEGAEEGDIVVVQDADWIMGPNTESIRKTFESLKKSDEWDSCFLHVKKPDGNEDTRLICVYRFKQGMKHTEGQLLSLNGIAITSPRYSVRKLSVDELYIVHCQNRQPQYLNAKIKYWEEYSDGRKDRQDPI